MFYIKKLINVSLQTKITGLVTVIVVVLTILLLGAFSYFDRNQIIESKNNLSLQTAKTISFMPMVQNTLKNRRYKDKSQVLIDQYSEQIAADFIVIQDTEGNIVMRDSDQTNIGTYQEFKDGYTARVFGGYYNVDSNEFVGPSIVGKAPILSAEKNVIGVVSVGYLKENVENELSKRLRSILYFSFFVLLIGIILSFILARHIRKDTMGLEPREIATLYRDRVSVLSSISEGVIATDASWKITLINESAKRLLDITDADVNKPIMSILPNLNLSSFNNQDRIEMNRELHINNKIIILNLAPVKEDNQIMGIVATFRDKTEMMDMINTLSEVKQYSDDLRAQTHEFSNKMYVISGLLQLEKHEDVLRLIQGEVSGINTMEKTVFNQIKDSNVQAILLGKMSKASEKKIDFSIDGNSSLEILPSHIKISHVITIIGNLVDNAFEEVENQNNKRVTFFTLDLADDVIFEIADNGSGLKVNKLPDTLEHGYSTKNKGTNQDRGFGLFNVKTIVNNLHGSIEIHADSDGTIITVYIPKLTGVNKNDSYDNR